MKINDVKKFAEELNDAFGPPHFPKDFFIACVSEDEGEGGVPELSIEIGGRDAQFDETGECVAAGTFLLSKWFIKDRSGHTEDMGT